MISFEKAQLAAMSAMDMLFFRKRASACSKRTSSIASRITIPASAQQFVLVDLIDVSGGYILIFA